MNATRMAKALGWFSIALGMTQLLAPRWLDGRIGAGARPALMRTFGLRELGTGAAVLARPDHPGGLWGRVAGDAVDLGALVAARRRGASRRIRLAMLAVAGVAVVDALVAARLNGGWES